ncbi:MFS transporter [Vacuolonema iberomarrocanum]|uniref:MFS transporter n=1 Tax=Vacuolonema iberomarrocanum TaxID=3454632 RepID=UPI0019FD0F9D|nr:MFS transporter [filamentous cyanobacterium LEGE 07170]
MQGSITLLWVIYVAYLPEFLGEFGLPLRVATILLIVENLLSAATEPLMGNFSDRSQRWVGTRFPFIAFGIILSSILFLALPIVAFAGGLSGPVLQGLVIMLLVSWALAMTIFRSPVLSLLGRYAISSQLPFAASILTLVGALASAVAPLANQALLQLGAPLTFVGGTLILLGAAIYLRRVVPPASIEVPRQTRSSANRALPAFPLRNLIFVFLTGMGITIGFRLLLFVLPAAVPAESSALGRSILLMFFGAIALSALPMGAWAVRLGTVRALLLGLGSLAVELLLLFWFSSLAALMLVVAVLAGFTFSLVSNCTLPFALSLVPPARAALGTGLFFGGGAMGSSLFFSLFQDPTLAIGSVFGAIAFLCAAFCVVLCRPLVPATAPSASDEPMV